MSNYKPLLFSLIALFLVAGFMNFFVSPSVEPTIPVNGTVLYTFYYFVDEGVSVSIIPFVGGILDTILGLGGWNTISVSWLWFNNVQIETFMLDQITLMSLVPTVVLVPLMILFLASLIYFGVSVVRGI